mmetsp:Transcript_16165/g.35095  ORF Transcript_16165/g.35095 Transcript_16165/m.35095 type:complete len:82 (+) Transcript_16165:262-507(+)
MSSNNDRNAAKILPEQISPSSIPEMGSPLMNNINQNGASSSSSSSGTTPSDGEKKHDPFSLEQRWRRTFGEFQKATIESFS